MAYAKLETENQFQVAIMCKLPLLSYTDRLELFNLKDLN